MLTPQSVCELVLGLVNAELQACGRPVGTAYVHHGDLAVECCEGVLAVRWERIFKAGRPFPVEATVDVQCEILMGIVIVVSVWRCTPVVGERGEAPAPALVQAAAAGLNTDAAAMWRVLASEVLLEAFDPDDDDEVERGPVNQVPVSAQGGCIGVETRVTLGFQEWCLTCP